MIQKLLLNNNEKNKDSIYKKILKILKILIILVFVVISFWGCGQQLFDKNIMTFNQPGGGFEICINPTFCNNHHISGSGGIGFIFYSFISNFGQAIKLGPFYGFFVFPLAFLTTLIGNWFSSPVPESGNLVITIFLIVLLIRLLTTLITYKQFTQQIVMQQVQEKVAKIKAKYQNQTDFSSKQRMQMEIMAINRKFGVNPFSAIGNTFITLPFFYSMYRVFSSLRIIKVAWVFQPKYHAIYSPVTAIFHYHYYIYIIFVIILVPLQILSYQLPSIISKRKNKNKFFDEATKKQMKQQKLMINIVSVVFVILTVELPVSIAIYWIFSSIYTIIQTLIANHINNIVSRKDYESRELNIFKIIKKKIKEKNNTIIPI